MRASSSAVGSWRTLDSGGSNALMASMMVSVSALASVRDSATGLPTRTRTVGGLRTSVKSGTRAERGHTFSVPHNPTGTTVAPVDGGQAGRSRLAVQLRVEEVTATGDRALREHDHDLARLQGGLRVAQRLARATAPVDADAADGPGDRADDGGVEDLLLPEEAHRAADLPGDQRQGGHVEIAPVVRRPGAPALEPARARRR